MNLDGVFLWNGYADYCAWWARGRDCGLEAVCGQGPLGFGQLKVEGAAWAHGEKGEVILELPEAGEGLGCGLGRGTSEEDGDKKVLSCPRGSQGRTGSEIRPQYTVAVTPSAGSLPQELSWGDSRRGTDD